MKIMEKNMSNLQRCVLKGTFKYVFYYVFLFISIFLTPAYGQNSEDGTASKPEIEAYFDHDGLWVSKLVNVCWEPNSKNYDQQKGWVEQSVRDLIEGKEKPVSGLRFVNSDGVQAKWKTCKNDEVGIRITILDEHPSSLVGRQWARDANDPRQFLVDMYNKKIPLPTKMVLNFEFEYKPFENCKAMKEHCIRALAVHEFMHAIGFLHEHLRKGAPDDCKLKYAANKDFAGYMPVPVGLEYDPDSHMTYCGDVMYRKPIRLSARDKEGLVRFYDFD